MSRVCIFGGTTEGRRLAVFLSSGGVSVTVCVATEYGEASMPENARIDVRTGRLDAMNMVELFLREKYDVVINAVHPYAALAAVNIAEACKTAGIEHIRLLRESTGNSGYFNSIEEAVAYLNGTAGNIFVTTGAKDLMKYTGITNFMERLYVRILPFEESLKTAHECGFPGNRIIALQGPFSVELNVAMLKGANARFLVTKDSGREGGFYEKLAAAEAVGAEVVVIGRKPGQEGLSYMDTVKRLEERFRIVVKPVVNIVGIGPGNRKNLTVEALEAIKHSDCLIGSPRTLELFRDMGKPAFTAIASDKIISIINDNMEFDNFAVLMSGDTGFYSGAKKLTEKFGDAKIICGISSVSYFCAKIGIAWDEVELISLHGRSGNLIHSVKSNAKTIALVGGAGGVNTLARELCEYGFGDLRLTVGERLSYADEKISVATATEGAEKKFDSLSIVLIENPIEKSAVSLGLDDDLFIRGNVPMTKSEIRAIIMSKLKLHKDSIAFDIGAGTGSVAVEMAIVAYLGEVYAVEKNPTAITLIETNKRKFKLSNLQIIEGEATVVLRRLPKPSHAFIGGSSGNMREIINVLLDMNENIHIVATAITLETLAEIVSCAKDLGFTHFETTQITAAHSRKLGGYNMMTGQNPVYVIVLWK